MFDWATAIRFIGIGFYISACIIGLALGGLWLDNKLNTNPVFLLIGLILGLIAAFWGVYQLLLPLIKNNKTNNKREKR